MHPRPPARFTEHSKSAPVGFGAVSAPSPHRPASHDASERLRMDVASTQNTRARSYLNKRGYFYGLPLPEFFAPAGLDQMTLSPVPWDPRRKSWPFLRSMPHDIYAPKGHNAWRRFSLLHPYAYWHLVTATTDSIFWPCVQEKLGHSSSVACYSIPTYHIRDNPTVSSIRGWLAFEKATQAADIRYSHLAMCDIGGFYPSVYTHSIAWAVDGKPAAKATRGQSGSHGDKFDVLFRRARDNQTNGLPVGNLVSDLFAELILADVDTKITTALSQNLAEPFEALRFRDDYRVLARSEADARKAVRTISRVLQEEYDLTLNAEKTRVVDDVVAGSTRPWQAAWQSNSSLAFLEEADRLNIALTPRRLEGALLATYHIQRQYPAGRPAVTILNRLAGFPALGAGYSHARLEYAIALLRRLMTLREEVIPPAVRLIDMLLDHGPELWRTRVLDSLLDSMASSEDATFEQLWLLRLTLHFKPQWLDRFKVSNSPIVRLAISPGRNGTALFQPIQDIGHSDQQELTKFTLFDYAGLKQLRRRPIPAHVTDVFLYDDPSHSGSSVRRASARARAHTE